jgi:hypothetical protein
VNRAWNLEVDSNNVVDVWQQKLRLFRRLAKGWSNNYEAAARKQKKDLMREYDVLDINLKPVSFLTLRGRDGTTFLEN